MSAKPWGAWRKGMRKQCLLFLIVWEPEGIRWNYEVLGLKQTKTTFPYRFLKSLSQDAVEAEGVKFAKKIGLNKSHSQHREVLWWLLFCVWSLAQELWNQFLYETGRINHGTIHRINHALFLFSFLKDSLLAFGLSGPFIRQIREFPVTRVDTEEPMLFLVLYSFSTTKWSCDGTVQNIFPGPFTLALLALNLNSFVLSWNLWAFGMFLLVNIVVIKSEPSSVVIDFL